MQIPPAPSHVSQTDQSPCSDGGFLGFSGSPMMQENARESCRGAGVQHSRVMLTPAQEQCDTAGVGRRPLPKCGCSASALLPTSLVPPRPPFCPLLLAPHFALLSHCHFLSLWMAPATHFSFILPPHLSSHPPSFSLSLLLSVPLLRLSLEHHQRWIHLKTLSFGGFFVHFCSACKVK